MQEYELKFTVPKEVGKENFKVVLVLMLKRVFTLRLCIILLSVFLSFVFSHGIERIMYLLLPAKTSKFLSACTALYH